MQYTYYIHGKKRGYYLHIKVKSGIFHPFDEIRVKCVSFISFKERSLVMEKEPSNMKNCMGKKSSNMNNHMGKEPSDMNNYMGKEPIVI